MSPQPGSTTVPTSVGTTATPWAMTSTTTPSPALTVNVTTGAIGIIVPALLSGAFLAAVVAAVVNVWLARRKSREEERARVRSTLAEAFQAYAEYKEFPYAIRRRRTDKPADERVRLSEELRKVQARLSYYETWTSAESAETGLAYGNLITEARRIAGGAMRAAWNEPGLDVDSGMNIGTDKVDLRGLKPLEDAFVAAATAHVEGMVMTRRQRRIAAMRQEHIERLPNRPA